MARLWFFMREKAVLWERLNHDHEDPVWAKPIEIDCRWEYVQGASQLVVERLEHIAEVVRYQATAYVDREVRVGDYIMLGSLSTSTKPDPRDEESWDVSYQEKAPNFRAMKDLRKLTLFPSHLTVRSLHGKGVEQVGYYRLSSSTNQENGVILSTNTNTPITIALGQLSSEKVPRKGDGYILTADRIWVVPKHELPDEPGAEDYIIDSRGDRWDVISWDDGVLSTWWRLYTKRGA